MRKAKVTYNAPKGDSKVVEMGGVTFYDGQEIELNTDDHGAMISKLEANQGSPNALFDIEVGEEEDRPKRGRPVGSKTRDLKAGIEEGRDHDFEGGSPRKPLPIARRLIRLRRAPIMRSASRERPRLRSRPTKARLSLTSLLLPQPRLSRHHSRSPASRRRSRTSNRP
jgi:hypothetical protein